jgi:hypothetical protein
MMGELSKQLKEFVGGHFHSVIRLEVLLLLSEDGDRVWTADTVDRKLNLTPPSAKAHLDELVAQGLLVLDEEKRYRYHPSSDELNKTVRQLSNAYATQRVAVLTIIFANPDDRARLFSEAFRMINGKTESNGLD